MKRRKFMIAFGVMPPMILASCVKDYGTPPSTPTIVTGNVIDENNLPVMGWGFSFGGYTGGYPAVTTFTKDTQTDKDGIYYYSIDIPLNTRLLEFAVIGFIEKGALNTEKTRLYTLFFEKDGKIESYKGQSYPKMGETNIFNFKIIKN